MKRSNPSVFSFLILCTLVIGLWSCQSTEPAPKTLPYLGNRAVENGDTIYHTISDFQFVNQDSQWVTNQSFRNQIYVADFFFTSCPTICPKVKKQMLRIHDKFKEDKRFAMISHSIDTKRDTVGRLNLYAKNLEVSSPKWHFVTGDDDHIYEMADEYFIVAQKDPDAPGGFDHSGRIILVDEKGHVRSFADGTIPEEVDELMEDIEWLLNQKS